MVVSLIKKASRPFFPFFFFFSLFDEKSSSSKDGVSWLFRPRKAGRNEGHEVAA